MNTNDDYTPKPRTQIHNDANGYNKTKRSVIDKRIQYHKDNLDKCREYNFQYWLENKDRMNQQAKERYYALKSWGGSNFGTCSTFGSLVYVSVEVFQS